MADEPKITLVSLSQQMKQNLMPTIGARVLTP
jgi:hypothetical protein